MTARRHTSRKAALLLLLAGCALLSVCAGLPAVCAATQAVNSAEEDGPREAVENPYQARVRAWQAQFNTATAPEAAVLLARIYKLRDFVDDRAALARFFAEAAGDPERDQLVRDEALHYLALIDVHQGDFSAAESKLKSLGFIRSWSLAGPFASPEALESKIRPESGFHAGAIYADSSGKSRTWRSLPEPGPKESLDVAEFLSSAAAGVVYVESSVYSERARTVAVRFSAESSVALFLNGEQVFAADCCDGGLGFDQHVTAVALQPGWNAVVLRLSRKGQGSWRFGARLTELAGGGIGLAASPSQPARSQAAIASAAGRARDLVQMAQAAVDADPGSAAKLETLGRLEHERARPGEFEHLEAAARRSPTAERWLAVADTCGEGPCRFAALSAAVGAEPENEFATLALANYYFGRSQMEKTRDLLRRAVQLAPGDFVARNTLADLYLSVGLNSQALEESRRLECGYPAPLWLRRKLAARYADFGLLDKANALLEPARRDKVDGTEERTIAIAVAQRRHDAAGLRAIYEQMVRLDPADGPALAALAKLEAGAGNFAAAEKLARRAVEIAPEDEGLREQFANLLERAGQPGLAQQQLARALAFNPHLEAVRRRLEYSNGESPSDSDAPYLTNAAELAATAQRMPLTTTGNVVELADIRVERVFENGVSSSHVQQVFYIATEQGARDYGTRSVQYTPGSQQLEVLRARVYKRDGRVLEADEGKEGGEAGLADTAVSMYYDVRSRAIHFPALEKQDVIELEYRLTPVSRLNPYGDYFGELVVFRSAVEEQLQRYVLITPAGLRLNVTQERLGPPLVTVRGTERIYAWEVRNTAALPSEPRGPALTDTAPYVHVSTFHSWDEVGRWYAQLIEPQFALDAALRESLARLLRGKQTEREKISAIHEFVLRNTHYVALEFGIYSFKPYPVSQTFARRYGDCKDKASLMIALLRQAGVEADIALVRTRRLGDVGAQATSIALFNHAVVYVPRYDLWLDGTAEYAGSRELPLDDQGAMALVVSADGHASLRRIPVTQPEDNYTRRTVRAQVEPDGHIAFSGTAYTRGEDAPGLRREFETPERQRDSVRDRLAEIYPSVRVEDVRVEGATDLEHDVNVEFRGVLDSFTGRQTVLLASSWMPRSYVQTLAPLGTRTQELRLPAPWTTEEELHFQLPSGATVTAMPSDVVLQTPFGSASLQYERRKREIVIRTSVQFRKLRIAPAEYPDFRDFCQQLERAFRSEVKVALPQ